MKDYSENQFIFAPRYHLLRHLTFWAIHVLVFTFLYKLKGQSWSMQFAESLIWVAAFMIYCYPIMYYIIPRFLLKGKLIQFFTILILWGVAGYLFNFVYRKFVFFEVTAYLSAKMNLPFIYEQSNPWAPSGYIVMNLMAGYGSMIVLFKYWAKKQKEYLTAEKEKAKAELQLLKAQVHPHFLFNTLNNIYSFALQHSPKTPDLVLKLSSLLSYILYDCKANEVLLERELLTMRNYIDLEKERYNKLEVSLNYEGDIKDKWIAPLLILPFLENAFKHGTSEQLEKPWLSVDVVVKQNVLRCKIVNSKNELTLVSDKGIGIQNVRKRLAYLYPGNHELKLNDESNFFVVSLWVELNSITAGKSFPATQATNISKTISV